MKKSIVVFCLLLPFAVSCGAVPGESVDLSEPTQGGPGSFEERTANTIRAKITMEDGGEIEIDLYPDLAPQSVRNFVYLARQGYYDGLKFHRIMYGFMIQGGCPDGTGTGGPGYNIKGEFAKNGVPNDLAHERGVMSMARSSDPDSAGSQFFIMVKAAPHLDKQYAAFGRVISGMDVADKIVAVERDARDMPLAEQKIKTVAVHD